MLRLPKCFFFQAEDGIRDFHVTGVQTCALPILNAALGRSLRARAWKWKSKWSYADGLVDPDSGTQAALAAYGLTARSYSASSLQQFAACPYRFLLHAIHQLRPRKTPAALEQMDPLTRGGLFHAVQRDLYMELQREGLLPM